MRLNNYSQRFSLSLIGIYQWVRPLLDGVILTVFGFRSECKHVPTCSEYAKSQIRDHGTIRGILQGAKRLLTCI